MQSFITMVVMVMIRIVLPAPEAPGRKRTAEEDHNRIAALLCTREQDLKPFMAGYGDPANYAPREMGREEMPDPEAIVSKLTREMMLIRCYSSIIGLGTRQVIDPGVIELWR
jgi:hypothetical protein